MKSKYYISILILILFNISCASTSMKLNNDSNINFATTTITINDNQIFHVKDTDVEQVNKCLATNPSFGNKVDSNNTNGNTNIDSRTVTKRALPLDELIRNKKNFKIDYQIGINQLGRVILVKIENYNGNIDKDQAHKSALNLMNMEYEPNENAPCIALGRYSLSFETD